jgi:hypothetical protein
MRKYISLFFLVTLFLLSCKGNKTPEGIIDHDRMVNLLMEIHLTDGRMYNVAQNPDSLYKYGTGRYMNVFKSFHTDSAQFRKSLVYYATQPTELTEIYDKILKNLTQKTDSINKAQIKSHGLPIKQQ